MTKAKELPLPSVEYLNECFVYDEENGILIWKERPLHHFVTYKAYKTWNGKHPNKKAGRIDRSQKHYTERVSVLKINYYVHRLIFKMMYGYDPLCIDHINGNPLDNRINNLRSVTNKENNKNKPMIKHTGHIGVYFNKNKKNDPWFACIQVDGKQYTKYFSSEEEAISCRKAWNTKYGYHENHGRERNVA